MSTRRHFILQTAATTAGGMLFGASAQACAAEGAALVKHHRLRVLMLGATGYIGPHFVRAALERQHQVSVFRRSTSQESDPLPAGVETLKGDRNCDLESIRNRDWDAVLDLATYGPIWVRTLGEALRERTLLYLFISSNAVYDNPSAHDKTDEHSPLVPYEGSADPYTLTRPNGVREYGALKALCEREAERQFPDRTVTLRPGWLFGPGNRNLTFCYWPARMRRGGQVLAAGSPSTPVQFVDVRDLADWCVRMIERRVTGIYNVLGPAEPTTLDQLIEAARPRAAASTELSWVPSSWVAAQPDRELWSNLLFWTHESGGYAGMMRMSNERALAQGFTTRPASVSLADTFAWYTQQPTSLQETLLTVQESKDSAGALVRAPVPWPVYLERERELIARWRDQQTQSVAP